ncbi:MAG: aromatic amino acid ammonia-lyase [Deltaproteobacteria bacterium]|jgi:histidine ammonia-lyase|nr:aromatic amino acid ammonia-lyase [Deltaproteobacteria bacterium]
MTVELGAPGHFLTLEELASVARDNAQLVFSPEYASRVNDSRALVEKWTAEGRVMYGVTTGFGILVDKLVSPEEAARLQRNIVLTHSTSVGEPMPADEVRAVMLMMVQNAGLGYSGIRLETLTLIRLMLNLGLTPRVPRDGSVGYLCVEGHVAAAMIGEGSIFCQGVWKEARQALGDNLLAPAVLASKEGLTLLNGALSPTALAALYLGDLIALARTADVVAAMSLEVLKGTTRAFDKRAMDLKKHPRQAETADFVRRMLADSEIAKKYVGHRLQDALSLRGIAQVHGAVKKTLADARVAVEAEMNSCGDNPVIIPDGRGDGEALSSCNCDAAHVGLEMDSAAMAATLLAKMSERRNARLIDGSVSGFPWFLVSKPGLNSGLMIPQYTQAGLLNEMRMLSQSAVVDNVPTCGGQEDYVSMGYNAAKKARPLVEKLEYILAIELLGVYQAHQFMDKDLAPSSTSRAVLAEIGKTVPVMTEDMYIHPHIVAVRDVIRSRKINRLADAVK